MLKKGWNFLRYIGLGFIIFVLALIAFRLFVLEPFVVRGASMEQNFHDGDYLWIEKISGHISGYNRGEVIVLNAPDNPGEVYIKRIIGLPGEQVEVRQSGVYITKNFTTYQLVEPYLQGQIVYTKDDDVTLGPNQYFVMGDNRNVSEDSRFFGPISGSAIVGRVWFRLLPTNQEGIIPIGNITLNPSSLPAT
jgi:signal peptidase I